MTYSVRPEDYDFPMSETFRAWTYQYCGMPDPGYVPPQPDIAGLEDRINDLEAILAMPGEVPRHYHDQIQQLKAQVLFLQKKIYEMAARQKKKEKPTGIVPL